MTNRTRYVSVPGSTGRSGYQKHLMPCRYVGVLHGSIIRSDCNIFACTRRKEATSVAMANFFREFRAAMDDARAAMDDFREEVLPRGNNDQENPIDNQPAPINNQPAQIINNQPAQTTPTNSRVLEFLRIFLPLLALVFEVLLLKEGGEGAQGVLAAFAVSCSIGTMMCILMKYVQRGKRIGSLNRECITTSLWMAGRIGTLLFSRRV